MSAPTPVSWTREQLQARLDRAPFNVWLGLQIVDWHAAGITLELAARHELFGHAGANALHGGVIASLVDVAASFAALMQTGAPVVTVDMRIDYLQPATGPGFRVDSNLVRGGRRISVADARISALDGRLVASGRAVLRSLARPLA